MIDSLVWVIAIPLAGALLSVALPRQASIIGLVSAIATLAMAATLLWLVATEGALGYAIGGWSPGLAIALRADGLSALLLFMTGLVALAVSVYATAYFRRSGQGRHYWGLWLGSWKCLTYKFMSDKKWLLDNRK